MTALLRCTGLSLTYATGFRAGPLDGEMGPGVVWLRGGNGTGKTTLLRCICGDLRPTAGEVRICDQDPIRSHLARRQVAYLPAEPELPEFLEVDEAWQMMAAIRGAPQWSGRALCERVGLPGGMLLRHCSAGQRRMAELIANLAGNPSVLLLDEVFANLDPAIVAILVDLMEQWRSSRLMVVTSHQPLPLAVDQTLAL